MWKEKMDNIKQENEKKLKALQSKFEKDKKEENEEEQQISP